MTEIEHIITCLGEEGSEIAQDCCKIGRFGPDDVNVLNPTGPNNVARLVNELNDLQAVVEMLITRGIIPEQWQSRDKVLAKKNKVLDFMAYARTKGTIQGPDTRPRCPSCKGIGWDRSIATSRKCSACKGTCKANE